ncbi:MAG: D-glycero-beta-D-manno-heptose 1-phosphate adenylyltransferase [Sedimentisphaerales bacterium]|nr:D-glycero-beta-D-manno-heptose 1-phosphate adenylyltransferase [Sedimentisphaerales bacterium]
MTERLLNVFNAVGPTKILLAGDFMLDNYLYGNIDRISPEAPVMVLNVTERLERPGGAGSVAADIVALGGQVACMGVVGDDANGIRLRSMLEDFGSVNVDALIVAPDRPTTSKERIIGLAQQRHQQQLMRIDQECRAPLNDQLRQQLTCHVEKLVTWCDVVCLEDYNKGVLSPELCSQIIAVAQKQNKRVLIDPAAIKDYSRYRGAWLVKPNRRELSLASGRNLETHDEIAQAASQLAQEQDIQNIVVTLDKQGAFLVHRDPVDPNKLLADFITTRPRSVYDVTGAGDMVLATLGMLAGADYQGVHPPSVSESVALANVAGGLEVERFGSVPLSRDEILAELTLKNRSEKGKIRSLDSLVHDLQWHRQQNLKVVFTNGCFDILHPGHIGLLSFAKEQGDILVVAINSDASVRKLKGPQRPILKEHDRAALLSALAAVDYVIIFDAPTPIELVEAISPDILVKGSDWTGAVVGQEWVESHGGKVVLVPLAQGQSTTNIIEQVIQKTSQQLDNKQ